MKKRRYYTYMAVLCSLLVFTGCDKESVVTPDTEEKVPITLSASSLPVSVDVQTRAETINNRSIGIVAANATGSNLSDVTSWTGAGYYLDHVRATGTNANLNGEKEVTFTQSQWWPFNSAEYLAFVAYSPYGGTGTGNDTRVSRVGITNTLKVTANTTNAFPDFLYTVPVGPWNKETAKAAPNKALSLGEFQHAMAKLDIEVKLVDKLGTLIPASQFPDPNRLKITELKVSTGVNNGEFDLLQTTSPKEWTSLDVTGVEQTVRTHINTSTTLTATLPTYTDCLLLPGTEDKSYVSIKIQELHPTTSTVINEVTRKAKITEFKVSPGVGATLEMGKTTKLTIKVRYVGIPNPPDPTNPETELILQGQLEEWDYKGKSEVIIE